MLRKVGQFVRRQVGKVCAFAAALVTVSLGSVAEATGAMPTGLQEKITDMQDSIVLVIAAIGTAVAAVIVAMLFIWGVKIAWRAIRGSATA